MLCAFREQQKKKCSKNKKRKHITLVSNILFCRIRLSKQSVPIFSSTEKIRGTKTKMVAEKKILVTTNSTNNPSFALNNNFLYFLFFFFGENIFRLCIRMRTMSAMETIALNANKTSDAINYVERMKWK